MPYHTMPCQAIPLHYIVYGHVFEASAYFSRLPYVFLSQPYALSDTAQACYARPRPSPNALSDTTPETKDCCRVCWGPQAKIGCSRDQQTTAGCFEVCCRPQAQIGCCCSLFTVWLLHKHAYCCSTCTHTSFCHKHNLLIITLAPQCYAFA